MSQVTEQSVRFQTALASIKLIQASAVLDLTEDDFDFLTSNKVGLLLTALVLVAALRLAFMVRLTLEDTLGFLLLLSLFVPLFVINVIPVTFQTPCLSWEALNL